PVTTARAYTPLPYTTLFRSGGGTAGGVSRRAQPRGQPAMSVRHLYVHLPFCASRCGYCDFVTVVGRGGKHGRYVDALLAELELEDRKSTRLNSSHQIISYAV